MLNVVEMSKQSKVFVAIMLGMSMVVASLAFADVFATSSYNKGDASYNIEYELLVEDETGTGVVYTPKCIGYSCHLPFKIKYSGYASPSSLSADYKTKSNIDILLQKINFDDDIRIVDVRTLVEEQYDYIEYKSTCNPYQKVLPNSSIETISNCTMTPVTKKGTRSVWKSLKDVTLSKDEWYYIDIVGGMAPQLTNKTIAVDVIPKFAGFEMEELAWWDLSYAQRYNISCTGMTDGTPILINGSAGFNINGNQQYGWTYCMGTGTAVYYNDETDWVVANDTVQLPVEIESGDSSDYTPSSVWDASYLAVWHCSENTGTTVSDSADSSASFNGTMNVSSWSSSGRVGNACYPNHLMRIQQDVIFDTGYTNFTIQFWVNHDVDYSGASPGRTDHIFGMGGSGLDIHARWENTAQDIRWYRFSGGESYDDSSGLSMTASTWYLQTYVHGTGVSNILQVNNVTEISIATGKTNIAQDNTFAVGAHSTGGSAIDAVIDEVRILKRGMGTAEINSIYQNMLGTSGFGSISGHDGISDSAPVVNLDYPATGTAIYIQNVTLRCNITDDNDIVNVSLWANTTGSWALNRTTVVSGSGNTSFIAEFNLTGLDNGIYSWNCVAYDDANQSGAESSNFTFTVDFWIFDRILYTSSPHETTSSNITLYINITDASKIDDINATLTWNNTVYTPSETSNNSKYMFRYEVDIPLIAVNNTNITFYWNYTVYYTDGGSYANTTLQNNHTVIYGYSLSALTAGSNYVENQVVPTSATLFNYPQTATLALSVNFNGSDTNLSYSSRTGTTDTYIVNLTAPILSNSTESFTLNVTLNITYGGLSRIETTTTSINVYKINFTECATGNTVLNFTFRDEETRGIMIGDLEVVVHTALANYSFDIDNVTSARICMTPNWTSTPANVTVEYINSTTHTKREYYLTNVNLNMSSIIYTDLYLLTIGLSDPVKIIVKDEAEQPETGVAMKIQRFYASTNSYITVAMVMTDDNGEDMTNLRTNTIFYKFIAERGGSVLTEYAPSKIPFDSIVSDYATLTFKIVSTSLGDIFNYYGNIASSCTYTNSTTVLRCTATDTSGAVGTFSFLVEQQQALSWATVCSDSDTSSGVTFTCTLGTTANSTYRYVLYAETTDSDVVLESGYLNFRTAPLFGTMGIFLAFIMFLALCAVGIWNPNVSLTMGGISLIVSFVIGLYTIGIGSLIGLIVAIGIIIKKNNG